MLTIGSLMSFLKTNAVTAKNFYECKKLILFFVCALSEYKKGIEEWKKSKW